MNSPSPPAAGRSARGARRTALLAAWTALLVVLATSSGCLLESSSSSSGSLASAGERFGPDQLSVSEIQSELKSFFDDFLATFSEPSNRLVLGAATPEQRLAAQEIRVATLQGLLRNATAPNPLVGLLDTIVAVTLTRMTAEDNWIPRFFPGSGDRLLATLRAGEARIWRLADRAMTPDQQAELKALIEAWRADHPDQSVVAYVHVEEFSRYRRERTVRSSGSSLSVFRLLALDPLANLDPAVRELQQSRLLAERAMFYAERLPFVVRWQLEGTLYQTTMMPEIRQALADTTSYGESLARLTDTAQQLANDLPVEREAAVDQVFDRLTPEREAAIDQAAAKLTVEREAAIEQLMDGLAAEREAIVASLRDEDQQLTNVLREVDSTIEAGTVLATAVTETVGSVNTLMDKLPAPDPDAPPREPLDIAEVRATAAEVTGTVQELNTLVGSVDGLLEPEKLEPRMAEIERMLGEVKSTTRLITDRLFWQIMILIMTLLVGAVIAGLVYRAIAEKVFKGA